MLKDCERVLIVRNPASTRADQNRIRQQIIDPLQRDGVPIETFDTVDPLNDTFANYNILKQNLESGDLVISCGGDGLANCVGSAIIDSPLNKDISMAAAPYGRANCFAKSVNDSFYQFDIAKNLRQTNRPFRTEIGAIKTTVEYCNLDYQMHALAFMGIGMTAVMAEALNDPRYRAEQRQSRFKLLHDSRRLLPLLLHADQFPYAGPDGQPDHATEILYSQSNVLARYFKLAKSIFDNKNMMVTKVKTTPELLGKFAVELPTGGLGGESIESDQLELPKSVVAQVDGEAFDIMGGSKVRVDFVKSALGVFACHSFN